jgi:hypothetical protein
MHWGLPGIAAVGKPWQRRARRNGWSSCLTVVVLKSTTERISLGGRQAERTSCISLHNPGITLVTSSHVPSLAALTCKHTSLLDIRPTADRMLKRLARPQSSPWVCSRCLQLSHKQRQRTIERRFNSTTAPASARDPVQPPPYPSASSLYGLETAHAKRDDESLRKIFDDASFWKSFSQASKKHPPTGIVGNRYLMRPEGFLDFVTVTLQRCESVQDHGQGP